MSYNFNSIVGKTESDALKEMIFQRVRDRAQVLDETIKESYTTSTKNDVMDLARASVAKTNNPFLPQQTETTPEQKPVEVEQPQQVQQPVQSAQDTQEPQKFEEIKEEKIGFNNNTTLETYRTAEASINKLQEAYTARAIQMGMRDARESLNKRQGFMGALNFLNSQASIALVTKEANRFEALA